MEQQQISAKIMERWMEEFRRGTVACEKIYENFAKFTARELVALTPAEQKAVGIAQRELETIQWGVCAESQPSEVARVLDDLEAALRQAGAM